MNQARETVSPGSRAHRDITQAIEHNRPWIKNGLLYKPVSARREGAVIVIELKLMD